MFAGSVSPRKWKRYVQEAKKEPTKPKNRTNNTKEFFEQFEGVTGNYPVNQGFWGKSHQKVHPNVRQNICHTVSLWYLFCLQYVAISRACLTTRGACFETNRKWQSIAGTLAGCARGHSTIEGGFGKLTIAAKMITENTFQKNCFGTINFVKITKHPLYASKFLRMFPCKQGQTSASNITKKMLWRNYFCNNYKDYYKNNCSEELICNISARMVMCLFFSPTDIEWCLKTDFWTGCLLIVLDQLLVLDGK